ncbi:hypothetical protein ACQPUZ_19555, partial [Clostridium tertium]
TLLLMPITTWGLNSLNNSEIADGSAIGSTLRQVSGAIGSSLFIAIMTTVSKNCLNTSEVLANIKGINVAFKSSSLLLFVGLIVSIIYVKDKNKDSQEEESITFALEN